MPAGFRYAGVHAGIKDGAKNTKKDVAIIASDVPATTAGVFTKNLIQAAPVRLCRQRVHTGSAQAVIVNSGNANACTGEKGMQDALETSAIAASALNIPEEKILVCSTGTIGIPLPMDRIEKGVRQSAASLSPEGFNDAAAAIMTTDTRPKQAFSSITIDNRPASFYGMAKGSGMIAPNMATLLGFIMTDTAVDPGALRECLREATETSFNSITVDGDQSTNDTVLMLANGKAGNTPINREHKDWPVFRDTVRNIAEELAMMIVKDGEGATKFVKINIRDAASPEDARLAARAVANSLLVKTAWYGADPNWGRIMAALGYSGAALNENEIKISFDNLKVVRNGMTADTDPKELVAVISKKEFEITISLGAGKSVHSMYSCDISHGYVDINASYMT